MGALPALYLSKVAGELRIETVQFPGRRLAPPAVPLGSEIWAVSGSAEVEADLPATLFLSAGDRVLLAPAHADREGHRGLLVQPLGKTVLEVATGSSRLVLERETLISLRSKPRARVAVEVLLGPVEAAAPGWSATLEADETAVFHAGPPGFRSAPIESSRMTVARGGLGSVDVVWVRAQRTKLARATGKGRPLDARETDLRMAPAALPARVTPAGRRLEVKAPYLESSAGASGTGAACASASRPRERLYG
ncbi:MAG: hypothetical protein HY554_12245 [Elusimicrobia bacterium]|nr:hypothetical protein [Elusimicrobiota bacterium]